MGNNNSSYFKKLINDYIIYVPEFQRNYLQGDDSKESIKDKRDRLLKDIFECIESQSKSIDLGFIYGRVEQSYKGNLFYPYDGQQRLTTLYFLYLLIYFKFKIYDEIDSIKKKLSYQTRISTNRFIESFLSWILDSKEKDNIYNDFWNKDGKDLKGFIINQDWFMMTEWNYDVSIINMLSIIVEISRRIKENLGDKTEIVNFIDKDENNPFQFDFIYVDDISKSDDLYIKINARGKALSPFENLKSDIDGYWNNEDKTKLDAEWTEYVWNQLDVNDKNKEKSFDDSFFNLLSNIFYLQYLIGLDQQDINDKNLFEIENKYKKGIVDKEWITQNLCCDSPYQMISSFLDAMTGSFKSIKDKQIESVNRKIFGLGDYQNNNGQNKLERADLFEVFVYYYSVSSLFRKNDMEFTDKRNLLNEIETVTNRIIENQRPYLDSPTNLVKALKSVKVLIDNSIESHGVYKFFLSIDNDTKESIRNGLMKEQVEEEILKAKLIDKDSRYVALFNKGYSELKNKGQLGFIFYLITDNNDLSEIRVENVSYESFEKTLKQILSIQSYTGDFISSNEKIFNSEYEWLLRAILAKAKGSFFWKRSNNLLSFPLLNNDRDMSLHTFLNCYSSSNPKDVEYKFNLLDGLREVLNSFDSDEELNDKVIEDKLNRIIEDYKEKDSKAWYKFFVIYDGVFGKCPKGNIYYYSDMYVLLLDKKFRSGHWCEYYTFALYKALDDYRTSKGLNITISLDSTSGKEREESFLKFELDGIEYKCSMMNDQDGFIIKKNEIKIFNSDASLDSWDKWKEKSLKILNREE